MSNPLACHAGVDVGQERWRELSDLCEEHTDEHTFGYYDAAFMMAFAQGGQDRCVSNMLESIANAIKCNNGPGLRLLNYYDQRSFLVKISLFLSIFCVCRRQGPTFQQRLLQEVTTPVCEAIASFECKEYAQVFEKLFPIRYQLHRLGGSGAQVSTVTVHLIVCSCSYTCSIYTFKFMCSSNVVNL